MDNFHREKLFNSLVTLMMQVAVDSFYRCAIADFVMGSR